MKRGLIVAGNWKMNHGPQATRKFFQELAALGEVACLPDARAYLFPPAISLQSALEAQLVLQGTLKSPCYQSLRVGAQNAHGALSGAFTGELSGPMLQELGISTVLIGHSERRQFFGETDETARKRAESLLEQGFEVIYCVGENRTQRESNLTNAVLAQQIGILHGLPMIGKLILAYEPVWAIGTGLTAAPWQAQEAHAFIRELLLRQEGPEAAEKTPILYGGSVTPENVSELLSGEDVDGVLVGGASLKPQSFRALLGTLPDRSKKVVNPALQDLEEL